MKTLRPGDVAILHSLIFNPDFNGMECIVRDGPYQGFYYIDIPGYEHLWDYAHQSNLRKKEPPGADDAVWRQAMLDCIERVKQPAGAPA